jgi:hypothetical protein
MEMEGRYMIRWGDMLGKGEVITRARRVGRRS